MALITTVTISRNDQNPDSVVAALALVLISACVACHFNITELKALVKASEEPRQIALKPSAIDVTDDKPIIGLVKLDNLCVRAYEESWILHNFSLTIEPKESVAILCDKRTSEALSKLLMGTL